MTDEITANVLRHCDLRVRLIANYGAGVSHIDLQECRDAGIFVTNTPDVLSEATAELALTLMLMVARRAGEGERLIRAGLWDGWAPTQMLGLNLEGKVLGLVGFGRIAQALARKARSAFNMQIVYFSRHRASPLVEQGLNARHCDHLNELMGQADFVSLHCPGGPETRFLIDAEAISQMKRSAFLVNTARGEVICERDLIDALGRGTIRGAALDVYENEPQLAPALRDFENVVLLPHLGSATTETRNAMGMRAAENIRQFERGCDPFDRVA